MHSSDRSHSMLMAFLGWQRMLLGLVSCSCLSCLTSVKSQRTPSLWIWPTIRSLLGDTKSSFSILKVLSLGLTLLKDKICGDSQLIQWSTMRRVLGAFRLRYWIRAWRPWNCLLVFIQSFWKSYSDRMWAVTYQLMDCQLVRTVSPWPCFDQSRYTFREDSWKCSLRTMLC